MRTASLAVMLVAVVATAAVLLAADSAAAFCGFFVAKADAKLFNKASQVVLVRDGDHTAMTMVNDFQGKLKEFAVVIPVPTAITREQIAVVDKRIVEHLDRFTSARLVEYFDSDPCVRRYKNGGEGKESTKSKAEKKVDRQERAKALGVKIEAEYTVGEYDILILSAEQSDGLETWLRSEGYKIPDGAGEVLQSYIKQQMKFFVAKVNLAEHDKLGGGTLRPIQVAYTSPKFMLPIRLGTVNAKEAQDVIVYAITRSGRVETTNYRTVKLPSDVEVPAYTKDVFGDFYRAVFARTVEQHERNAVITEYGWDLSWCDPCAADPLSGDELRALGAKWAPPGYEPQKGGFALGFVTRLHARYDRTTFPEDLVFQVTADRDNFQSRYVMRHPFTGPMKCAEASAYRAEVKARRQQEAANLAELTGWKLADIKHKMKLD